MNLINSSKLHYRKIAYIFSALIVSGILPVIGIVRDYLYFQNNDDLFILGRVSGIFYDKPIDELIYVSPPLSTLMKYLYLFNGDYSWYTITLLLTQYLTVLAYLLIFEERINRLSKTNGFVLYLLVSLPIFIFFILFYSLQFTQTGIMAAGVGTLVYLLSETRAKKVSGLALIAVGILWRADGSMVSTLFVVASFWALQLLLNKKIQIKKTVKITTPVAAVLIIAYGLYVVNFNTWAPWVSQEKKEYVELKNVFTQLYGFESTAASYSDLVGPAKQAGFTANDWELFKKYYFLDSDIFGITVQKEIAENRILDSYAVFIYETLKNLRYILVENYSQDLLVMLFFILLALVLFKDYKVLIFFSYTIFVLSSYFLILLFGERLPDRVFWPFSFLVLVTFVSLAVMHTGSELKIKGWPRSIYLVFTVAGLSLTANTLFSQHQSLIDRDLWWKVAPQQQILNIDRVYFYEPDKPVIAFFSFYENFRKTIDPMSGPNDYPPIWRQMILIGWENKTPEFNKRISEFGLTEDLFTSVAKGDAYLATWTDPSNNYEVGNMSIFLREHKNIEVQWEEIPFVFSDSGLAIWRSRSFELIE